MDYNNFRIEDRRAMTVNPALRDDATNEIIEGSEEVLDNQYGKWTDDGTFESESIEDIEDDALAPEDRENHLLELGNVSTEINESSVSPDEALADSIASFSLGDSPAEVTVQYLSHKVYQGELTAEEAFNEAISSGINTRDLVSAYNRLKKAFS